MHLDLHRRWYARTGALSYRDGPPLCAQGSFACRPPTTSPSRPAPAPPPPTPQKTKKHPPATMDGWAGSGVAGLAAAALGAAVTLTDLGAALPLTQRNVDANAEVVQRAGGSAKVGGCASASRPRRRPAPPPKHTPQLPTLGRGVGERAVEGRGAGGRGRQARAGAGRLVPAAVSSRGWSNRAQRA